MKSAIILLFASAFCQSNPGPEYSCNWYDEGMTLAELKHNGCPFCGKFLCTRFGYLKEIKSCPSRVTLELCPDGSVPEEQIDYEKPYPGCCAILKCGKHSLYGPYGSFDHHLAYNSSGSKQTIIFVLATVLLSIYRELTL